MANVISPTVVQDTNPSPLTDAMKSLVINQQNAEVINQSKKKEALLGFDKLMETVYTTAAKTGIDPYVFISNGGADALIDQAYQQLSIATGRKLSGDEARAAATNMLAYFKDRQNMPDLVKAQYGMSHQLDTEASGNTVPPKPSETILKDIPEVKDLIVPTKPPIAKRQNNNGNLGGLAAGSTGVTGGNEPTGGYNGPGGTVGQSNGGTRSNLGTVAPTQGGNEPTGGYAGTGGTVTNPPQVQGNLQSNQLLQVLQAELAKRTQSQNGQPVQGQPASVPVPVAQTQPQAQPTQGRPIQGNLQQNQLLQVLQAELAKRTQSQNQAQVQAQPQVSAQPSGQALQVAQNTPATATSEVKPAVQGTFSGGLPDGSSYSQWPTAGQDVAKNAAQASQNLATNDGYDVVRKDLIQSGLTENDLAGLSINQMLDVWGKLGKLSNTKTRDLYFGVINGVYNWEEVPAGENPSQPSMRKIGLATPANTAPNEGQSLLAQAAAKNLRYAQAGTADVTPKTALTGMELYYQQKTGKTPTSATEVQDWLKKTGSYEDYWYWSNQTGNGTNLSDAIRPPAQVEVPKQLVTEVSNAVDKTKAGTASKPEQAIAKGVDNAKTPAEALNPFKVAKRPYDEKLFAKQKVSDEDLNGQMPMVKSALDTIARTFGKPTKTFAEKQEKIRAEQTAGNWVKAVWNNYTPEEKQEFVKHVKWDLENSTPNDLTMRFGSTYGDNKLKQLQYEATIEVAQLNAMAAMSTTKGQLFKEAGIMVANAAKAVTDYMIGYAPIVNGKKYNGDMQKFLSENPQVATERNSLMSAFKGVALQFGVALGDFGTLEKTLVQYKGIFGINRTKEAYDIVTDVQRSGTGKSSTAVSGTDLSSAGQSLLNKYKVPAK
jgi:hypothetical protein